MQTVVIGMSGGVDSSVCAALLKEQGYQVIGLFMKNWEEPTQNGACRSQEDFEDVARTADLLKIPYYSVNFVKEYQELVFNEFLADLKAGLTPNPDILCNREIKFNVFLNKALELGADFLATGHYCRLNEKKQLLKGLDPNKDQSYFLHQVSKKALEKVLFPIGNLPKQTVRKIAQDLSLPTAKKKDSTGICFIGKRDFKTFLLPFLGYSKGELKQLSGKVVGHHSGAAYYTIGQRHGLGLGGEGDPWYVVAKDIKANTVYVERGEHPALFQKEVLITNVTWIDGAPPFFPYPCHAKVRYRQKDQLCTLFPLQEEGLFKAVFEEPQRAVTAGQSAVFYQNDLCLGGGKIVGAKI